MLQRAESEARAGRLWKAKEILCGGLRSYASDARLLESYGLLLDQLGDRVEAGKYLFLSGSRDPRFASVIELFLERHGKGHLNNVISQFPKQIRVRPIDELPPVVLAELKALGLPESKTSNATMSEALTPPEWRQTLTLVGCAIVGIALLFALFVGFVAIGRWVWGVLGA